MKIGILTYHRTYNYGGCLQALATRLVLESMGHEVYYVDYWPDYHSEEYKLFSIRRFNRLHGISKIKYLKNSLMSIKVRVLQRKAFELYHKSYTYPYCKTSKEEFDVIVYGSDQIWRFQNSIGDYNPVYFGHNVYVSKKHIAYAASMGTIPAKESDIDRVLSLLTKFDAISVRENDLKEFLVCHGFNNICQVLDPTLLISSGKWLSTLKPEPCNDGKYVLVYALWEDVFDYNAIKAFANQIGCEVKILKGNGECMSNSKSEMVNPIRFVQLVNHADFIFSSSFHGLAFSIIFRKQFFISIKQHSARVKSLLATLGLTDRFIEPLSSIPSNMGKIDYEKVNLELAKMAMESMDFLKNEISES